MKEEIHREGKGDEVRQSHLKVDCKGWVNNIPSNDMLYSELSEADISQAV